MFLIILFGFRTAQLIVFTLIIAAASSAQLSCKYYTSSGTNGVKYTCKGRLTTTRTDKQIEGVAGTHLNGYDNDNVDEVAFSGSLLEVLPRNLTSFFKNYKMLTLYDINGLFNLTRSDFNDFRHLSQLRIIYIESITKLPRDTFFDLTKLEHLALDWLINLENLDADFLMTLHHLKYFSVRGSSSINQISSGFFRNQRKSLIEVDFSGTNLIRVEDSVFVNLQVFTSGDFSDSGCLDGVYNKRLLMSAIRENCQGFKNQPSVVLIN